MFTGLIKTIGTIRRVDQRGDCMVTIAMREPFAIEVGDSIACHGICLTATKVADNEFKVALSAETLSRSNAGAWAVGTPVNLEPSLRVGDSLGGHFVSGHVDALATAIRSEKSGDSTIWEFEVPATLAKFIAPKGSITIDGVSLTVNQVNRYESKTTFTVNIIPHTAQITGFANMREGTKVNIEVDMLARYVARMLEVKA
jgi:riboflavin synthase